MSKKLTSSHVLKKGRGKALKLEVKTSDWLSYLYMRSLESINNESYFLPYVSLIPLSVMIAPSEAYYIVKEENRRMEANLIPPIRAMFDATAGILRKVSPNSLLHHNLVIKVDTHSSAYGCQDIVNVMEYVTDCSNVHNLTIPLSHFREQFSKLSTKKPFASVTTDKCWAAISAVNKGFNNISNKEYLEETYTAFTNPKKKAAFFKKYIVLLLCSSHVSAIWLRDLLELYDKKQISKDDFHLLCSIIGLMYQLETPKELDNFAVSLFVIFTRQFYDDEVV